MAAERAGRDLSRLLQPASIAVFGGWWAERVVGQCRKIGYPGEVWPVHPRRQEIGGLRCYEGIDQLPSPPDASFIAVNRHQTIDVVRDLAQVGAGGAVCFASGFGESGEDGARLEEDLKSAASSMPFLGPNCYGLINYVDGALLWPDQHGGKDRVGRGVGLILQSGNIAINLTMNRRGLPIAYLATLGNQVSVDVAELIEAFAATGRVSAIGLLIESVGDPDDFVRATRFAKDRSVPIIALKSGASSEGAALALSHTGSLAGANEVMSAFLARLGVARVHSLTEFLETLKILHVHGPLPGARIATLSCSGGEAALVADSAAATGVTFANFPEEVGARIRETVNPLVAITNPFDYHTFDWGAPDRLARTFGAVLSGPQDMTLLIIDIPRADRCDNDEWLDVLGAFRKGVLARGVRAGVVATVPECMPEDIAQSLTDAGIVPLAGIVEALSAIAAAAAIPPRSENSPRLVPASRAATGELRSLSEWQAKARLRDAGIAVPEGVLCRSRAEALDALARFGAPLIAKAVSPVISHKTELGALRPNLIEVDEVARAYDELETLGEAVLVERMVPRPVAEILIGINTDGVLGTHFVIGAGGVMTELLRDTRTLLPMVTAGEIRSALGELRISALLDGHRGGRRGDVAAIVETILALQELVLEGSEAIHELEINPLMVGGEGQGAIAVDALIRIRERKS